MFGFMAGVPGRLKILVDRLSAAWAAQLDTTISSRASPSSQMSGIIKSIQRGTIAISGSNTSNTATISSVNMAKAVLIKLGSKSESNEARHADTLLTLTDATTITCERFEGYGTTTTSWILVEFY